MVAGDTGERVGFKHRLFLFFLLTCEFTWLSSDLKIVLCYICVTHGVNTEHFASRFVATYLAFPPGVEHRTIIACNGGPLKTEMGLLFASLPSVEFFPRENDGGWDISAYLAAARGPCFNDDMMVCMGESVYFHRAGWLKRMVDAWTEQGPGMYGFFSSHVIRAHLNTTAFCITPKALRAYSHPVRDRGARYEYEHGPGAFWRSCMINGMPVRFVTWDGIWLPTQWRAPNNILSRGDQSNLLCWCNHTENYFNADAATKNLWARLSDSPFR
jgi:hypothetical protein